MSELERRLVQGRECGECSACCVTLRIDEPTIKKPQDVPCSKLTSCGGCSIYESRPDVCRNWYCAWRVMPQLDDSWRPDRSEIMLRIHDSENGGLILQSIEKDSHVLTSEKVLGFVANFVEAEVPIYISVATKPGRCNAIVNLNDVFKPAVSSKDIQIAELVMLRAIEHAYQYETDPIRDIHRTY